VVEIGVSSASEGEGGRRVEGRGVPFMRRPPGWTGRSSCSRVRGGREREGVQNRPPPTRNGA